MNFTMYKVTTKKDIIKKYLTDRTSLILYKYAEFDGCFYKYYYHVEQVGINVVEVSEYETNLDRALKLYNSLRKEI